MGDRRYVTTTAGGFVLRGSSRQLVDHVVTALAAARSGRRAWIKSESPADEMAGFYAVEFAPVLRPVSVTAVVDGRPLPLTADSTPPWVSEIGQVAQNILTGGTPQ